jgi:hypothetical protein
MGQLGEPAGTTGGFPYLLTSRLAAYAFAMSAGRKNQIQDDFIAPARRALRRAARKVRAENQRLGLPLITVKNNKMGKPA